MPRLKNQVYTRTSGKKSGYGRVQFCTVGVYTIMEVKSGKGKVLQPDGEG